MQGTTRKRNTLSHETWGFHPEASNLVFVSFEDGILSSAAARATKKMMTAMLMMTTVMVIVITRMVMAH